MPDIPNIPGVGKPDLLITALCVGMVLLMVIISTRIESSRRDLEEKGVELERQLASCQAKIEQCMGHNYNLRGENMYDKIAIGHLQNVSQRWSPRDEHMALVSSSEALSAASTQRLSDAMDNDSQLH
jgi:hypothetical protein